MSQSCSPVDIKNKLLKALDDQNNIVDMEIITEIISLLEKTTLTREALEQTRLGKYINEIRKKLTSGSAPSSYSQNEISQIAKRAKNLVKRWRDNLLTPNDQSVNCNLVNTQDKPIVSEQLTTYPIAPSIMVSSAHINAPMITNATLSISHQHHHSSLHTKSLFLNYTKSKNLFDPCASTCQTNFLSADHSNVSTIASSVVYMNDKKVSPLNGILPHRVYDGQRIQKSESLNESSYPTESNYNINGTKNDINNDHKLPTILNELPYKYDMKLNVEQNSLATKLNSQNTILSQEKQINHMNANETISHLSSSFQITNHIDDGNRLSSKLLPTNVKSRKLKTTVELMAEIRAKSKVLSSSPAPVYTTTLSSDIPPKMLTITSDPLLSLSNINHSSSIVKLAENKSDQTHNKKRRGRHKRSKNDNDHIPLSPQPAHSDIVAANVLTSSALLSTTNSTLKNLHSTKTVQSKTILNTHSKTLHNIAAPKLKIILHDPPDKSSTQTGELNLLNTNNTLKISPPTIPQIILSPVAPCPSPNELLDAYNSLFDSKTGLSKVEPVIYHDTKENEKYLQSWLLESTQEGPSEASVNNKCGNDILSIPSLQIPYVIDSFEDEKLVVLPYADIDE